MKKIFYITILTLALGLSSCFKDTVEYTRFNLSVQEQTQRDGEYTVADDVEAYVYYADTALWSIDSYEAALERRLTNKKSGQTLTTPEDMIHPIKTGKTVLYVLNSPVEQLGASGFKVHSIYCHRISFIFIINSSFAPLSLNISDHFADDRPNTFIPYFPMIFAA